MDHRADNSSSGGSCNLCLGLSMVRTGCTGSPAVSVITLAVTRPVVKKIMPKNTPTNGELDIGKKAIVIEKIDPEAGTGRVRIEGVDWGAKTADSSVIEKGETVVVKAKGAAFVTVAKE